MPEEEVELGGVQPLDGLVVDREVEDDEQVAVVLVLVDLRPLALGDDVLDVERVPLEALGEHLRRVSVRRDDVDPGEAASAELVDERGRRDDDLARAAGRAVRRMRGRLGIGTERVVQRRDHVRDSSRGACNGRVRPAEAAHRGTLARVRSGFLLDPDVAYLNHASYGACPEDVFAEYQRVQLELERGPTDFFTRRVFTGFWGGDNGSGRLADARATLAAFVGARPEDLVFVPNATSGLNAVIRSLALEPGAEVLTTAHEYGAISKTWEFAGATLTVCEPEELAARIGPRTRAVSVSHVSSPTALVLPVEEVCAAARAHGALSIVDGARAPGHVPLDLESLGADVTRNATSGCGPEGRRVPVGTPGAPGVDRSARRRWATTTTPGFGERHGWQGTRDPAAYLTSQGDRGARQLRR